MTLTAIRTTASTLAILTLFTFVPLRAQDEVIYLSNTSVQDADGNLVTELYLMTIDEETGVADVEFVDTVPLAQVDALACSPDDARCFLIDKYDPVHNPEGGTCGQYNMLTGEFSAVDQVVDETGDRIPGIVLAGYSPGPTGRLFVASQDTHYLYTMDTDTGQATSLGPILVGDHDTVVDLEGADLVFTADSRMFVWANNANLPDAPSGLYEVFLPQRPQLLSDPIRGEYLGTGLDGADPGSHFFTGLAVRQNGLGDVVGVNSFDELHQQDQDAGGADVAVYDVQYDGQPLGHVSGDLHHSYDCYLETSLDRHETRPGEEIELSLRLVHNRTATVDVPFGLWIEDELGNVVVSRRSRSFHFEWGDKLETTVSLPIPRGLPAGSYTLFLGIDRMRQGEIIAQHDLTIVD